MKANAAICYEDLDEKRSEIKANLEDMIAGFEKIAAYDFCGCEEAEATKTDLKKVISTFKCAAEAFNFIVVPLPSLLEAEILPP